ncbi:MAG TPA: ABC transporter substrate-binding protein [Candidatus Acidoferrales bacterium]|nr:ABC transporter substrate-binding protein [Candidatus Acidoferrales bacterium]
MLIVLRAPSLSGLPFYIAEERGFFEKEGASVRCLHSHDPKRRVVRLLVEGEVAFYTSISAIVEGAAAGAQVKALCATSNSRHPCAARENIRSFADLKNRKIMVGGGRSRNEVLWLCRRYGWDAERDLEIVSGDLAERAKAFADPSFAAVFGRPQYLAWLKKGGFHLLPYPDKEDAWPEGCLATSQALIDEKPEIVQKIVNAVVAATDYARDHKDDAIDVAMKYVGYLGREAVEGNYDVLREWYSNEITATAIAHVIDVLGLDRARGVKLEDFADLSFLRRAKPT